jgi:hypothetical protein
LPPKNILGQPFVGEAVEFGSRAKLSRKKEDSFLESTNAESAILCRFQMQIIDFGQKIGASWGGNFPLNLPIP